MAVELSVVLRFETELEAADFLNDVESDFECDIITNALEEV